ncbi:uncharacterized protein LAJ45_08761 [Morchella importuna]|uniref:uncharacterized protein n=1 Tax=Morchella importuna TaxID=1174673 RepID=UPI001E8D7C88|nr:uncharacterized protein LAJ45_08761 [Morchella importuna]KAH8147283.1 hypothetical protein LAJ45_08761 [Morchella importuna]
MARRASRTAAASLWKGNISSRATLTVVPGTGAEVAVAKEVMMRVLYSVAMSRLLMRTRKEITFASGGGEEAVAPLG